MYFRFAFQKGVAYFKSDATPIFYNSSYQDKLKIIIPKFNDVTILSDYHCSPRPATDERQCKVGTQTTGHLSRGPSITQTCAIALNKVDCSHGAKIPSNSAAPLLSLMATVSTLYQD